MRSTAKFKSGLDRLRVKKTALIDYGTYAGVIIAFLIVNSLLGRDMLSRSFSGQLVPICCYVVMAVSLNLTVGILGELSLGHAGFMSVGAFSGIVAAMSLQSAIPSDALRLAIALVVGRGLRRRGGFIVGLPVLRLRGDYLAIVTLAFGEIIKELINCLIVGYDENGLHIRVQRCRHAQRQRPGPDGKRRRHHQGRAGRDGHGHHRHLHRRLHPHHGHARSGAEPDTQPLRPGHHGAARQPHRRRERGHQRHQIQIDGLCHLSRPGWRGRRPLRAESLERRRREVQFSTLRYSSSYSSCSAGWAISGAPSSPPPCSPSLPEALRGFDDYRMLIYAVVLILVMLATNNPQLRALIARPFAALRGAREKKGGAVRG